MSPMDDIDALIAGFKAFKREYEEDSQGKYRNLAEMGTTRNAMELRHHKGLYFRTPNGPSP